MPPHFQGWHLYTNAVFERIRPDLPSLLHPYRHRLRPAFQRLRQTCRRRPAVHRLRQTGHPPAIVTGKQIGRAHV